MAEGSSLDPIDPDAVESAASEEATVDGLETELGNSDFGVLEAAIIAGQFSGPLPPPGILKAYDEILEGGADRIFEQWERETAHRHALEERAVDAYFAGLTRAQWMAFIVILVIGVGGLVIVALGHPLVGLAGFFLALATVVASFFRRGGGGQGVEDGLDDEE